VNMRYVLGLVMAVAAYGNVGTVWAYGDSAGGGSSEGCKAKFSQFTPANNAEVAAKSAFSFFASDGTDQKTIAVKIKGESVPVTIVPKHQGYLVSGKLPDSVKGTFARINITAKALSPCEATDGWLLKVGN
jgi:hypothetical protein